jgi:hypothetical protein
MKIYKSPWVSYESYFVKTGEEGIMTTGYSVELLNGVWIVVKTTYVTRDIKMMPVAAENNIDLKDVFKDAILSAVHNAKDGERR